MKRTLITILSLLLFSLGVFADDIDEWGYQKRIDFKAKSEYISVFLDEDVYRYGQQDLADIRVINGRGEFIPYYISNGNLVIKQATQLEYDSRRILDFVDDKSNYIQDFKITSPANNQDIIANKISFEISDDYFLKKIKIYGSYDNKEWEFIKEDNIYRTKDSQKLKISLVQNYKFNYYRVLMLKDIEKTEIDQLQALYDNRMIKARSYQRSKSADYQIIQQDRKTIIEINNDDSLKIEQLRVSSKDNFRRSYRVFYKNRDEADFQSGSHAKIYQLLFDDFKIKENTIGLKSSNSNYLNSEVIKIEIYDGDNKPIKIDDIELNYTIDKVVFKTNKGQAYYLCFGNPKARRPIYDIEEFRKYIENKEQEEGKLLALEVKKQESRVKEKEEINLEMILNIVVTLVSLLLIFLLLKRLRFKDN
ncbi:uncharacterized protein DUF3999 [Orenia metallireducens]|jgi:hypothetical protein|uniref:DUF3999 domain-containing protein n=1 Tax=Orenia metallireducens TaxID=1413210 RepID=A0A285GAD0_9FIRM|nr:DUF3999 family protein [Orenia metallireducens]PRX28290.1 uncharacterized protein DUF3999 [Orenia metallireducens]SNY19486.1 Protein of unknown function [Orenia metallireducens]